jgi:23S rRNA (cytidine1920-2'-O)/16S rRNA (cytidine1409-2'-O)-methyltransferase
MGAAGHKKRVDLLLVERGAVESRSIAQAVVMQGLVYVGDRRIDKPGCLLCDDVDITVRQPPRYVSRGGLKLEHALEEFSLDVRGVIAADVGASTGGFTDCLLQHGAYRVYAIDVGYGQLDYRVRSDPRVITLDRTNVRHLENLPQPIDLATIDVSFISLRLVLPVVAGWLSPVGSIVALVKPQFEVGKGQVGRGGVVRDPVMHETAVAGVRRAGEEQGLFCQGVTRSPLTGPAGNVEFLVLLRGRSPFDR